MNIKQLGGALQNGEVLDINIITHSGLNRYAVQVVMRDEKTLVLRGSNQRPCFWRSLEDLQRALRRHRIAPPLLRVTVAQDEVIGR